MRALDPDSETPLYRQLRALLQAQIQSGALAVGARVPSERELADAHGVSRMTARQAIQLLAADGLVRSRTGKGTYVDRPKIDHSQRRLTGFTEEMRRLGRRPGGRLLDAAVRPAGPAVADRLRLVEAAPVIVIRRLRSADGLPLAIEIAHLDARRFDGLADQPDLGDSSLYAILTDRYGTTLAWADQSAEADLPTAAERTTLDMPPRGTVLRLERVSFDRDDQPVEYVTAAYRGDLYRLRSVLRPQAS